MRKGNKFLGMVLAVFCGMMLVGCGSSNNQKQGDPNTGSVSFTLAWPDSNAPAADPNTGSVVVQWKKLDEMRKKVLPKPADSEKVVTVEFGEEKSSSREKSSDEFYDVLYGDLFAEEGFGKVILYFYGQPNYEEYLGCRQIDADSFFRGTAYTEVETREYWINAMTYSELSGYCFSAEAHVSLLPGSNRILFSFKPSGNLFIPCYISNPPGDYLANRYDQYPASLKSMYSYIWNGPYYNEQKELEFTVACSYGTVIHGEKMKLEVTATDGLHVLQFFLNPADIINHPRPFALNATEVPVETIQYSGEPEHQKRNIVVDLADELANFPMEVKGTTTGINQVCILVVDTQTRDVKFEDRSVVPDADGKFSKIIFPANIFEGERLEIQVCDWEHVSESNTLEYDSVIVEVQVGEIAPITITKNTYIPNGSAEAAGEGINAGTYKVHCDKKFLPSDLIVSFDHPSPKPFVAKIRLVLVEADEQVVGEIISPPSGTAGFAVTFNWDKIGFPFLEDWSYGFRIEIDAMPGMEAPAEFKSKLSICGKIVETGEYYQTPFVEGQNIYIAP